MGSVLAESRIYTWDQALQEALYRNPQILAAQSNLEAATGVRLVYRSRALPRAVLSAPLGYRGKRGTDKAKPFVYADAQITQPLFDYGLPASLRRGELEAPVAAQNVAQITLEQLHSTRLAFIAALTARENLEILQVQSARLQRNVDSQQARFEAGQISIREVKQARSQCESLKASVAAARRDYVLALTRLCGLMGRDQGGPRADTSGPDVLLDGDLSFSEWQIDLPGEVARALANRPDLATLRLLIRQARTSQTLAESGLYPSLTLVAGGRYVPTDTFRSNNQSIQSSSVQTEYRIGTNLSWRVLDFGTSRGAAMRQDKLAESYDLLKQRLEASIPREIAAIRNTYEQARARYQGLRTVEKTALESLDLIESQVKNGTAAQLDYSFAQNDYLNTLLNLTSAKSAALMAAAELDRATGRYVAPFQPPASGETLP
jgi:outer membrane protein TolC